MQFSNMVPENLEKNYDEVIELISKSNRILISSHVRPDGDAIGSVSGLTKALQKAGKTVEVALADGVPARFSFVFPQVRLYKATRIEVDHDLLLILDAGDDTRAGIEFVRDAEKTVLVNIDHHSSNNFFGDLNIVDTKASSACEMIVALIDRAKDLELDKDNALSLLLGLTTDSRSFQNEGLRHTAHLAAAKLLATGVDNSPILNMLNSGRSETDLRVQGFGLTNFRLECDGALATLVITQKDLQKMNAKINNIFASGIFNILTSMKKTLASVVIFEREDGMSFCEFRSRSGIDVKEVAVKMGGGGHIPASGCSKNEAIEKVAQEAVMLMKDQVTKSLKGKRN